MAQHKQEYEAARAEFMREAGAAFDRMMKEDQEQIITFDQMEDRALEAGGKLERRLMEQCLARAGEGQDKDGSSRCPRCGKLVQLNTGPKERCVRGRTGPVSLRRAEGYCPSCRKAFFPSGPEVGAGG